MKVRQESGKNLIFNALGKSKVMDSSSQEAFITFLKK